MRHTWKKNVVAGASLISPAAGRWSLAPVKYLFFDVRCMWCVLAAAKMLYVVKIGNLLLRSRPSAPATGRLCAAASPARTRGLFPCMRVKPPLVVVKALYWRYTSEYGSVPGETDPEVESDTVKLKAIFSKLCSEAGLHPPPGQVGG